MKNSHPDDSNQISTSHPTGMSVDEFILLERARALYSRLNSVMVGTVGVSVLTIMVLWNGFSRQRLIAWLTVALLLVGVRWLTSRKYNADNIDLDNYKPALAVFIFWAFVAGATWGMIPILFFAASKPIYILFITCVYTGYMATVAASTGLYVRVFLAFSIVPSVCFALRTYLHGGEVYGPMSLLIVFYFIMSIVFARGTDRSFTETKALYFENAELLREVSTQRDRAEEAIDQKNNFLASASHDLRQPLHALGLFVETLEPTKLDSYQRQVLEKISQSNKALNSLLHGLLDISRLDAGVVEFVPTHFLLDELILQLSDEFAPQAARKALRLNIKSTHSVAAYSDAVILERILRNVIDNAIKYTEEGSVTLGYEALGDEKIKIYVEDTGLGIEGAVQEKVFNEFYQIDNPERDRRKGIGLGLAIVKRLCELAKIQLSLHSEARNGTQIEFVLATGDQDLIQPKDQKSQSSLFDLKVALIEDEQDIRNASTEVLEQKGCKVFAAETIQDMLQLLANHEYQPDVIIADYRLRNNENGLDAIKKIRDEYNAEIPALLVTGDTAPDRLKAANAENIEVLHKPVELDVLEIKLRSVASKHDANSSLND